MKPRASGDDADLPRGLRLILGFCAVLAFGLCIWQIGRHSERNEGREAALLVAETAPLTDSERGGPDTAWRVVRWQGRFVGPPALMSTRKYKEQLGYGLLRVFETTSGQRFLVDLGWVPPEGVAKRIVDEEAAAVVTGQLRPVTGGSDLRAIDGHSTKIWPYGASRAAAAGMGAETEIYLLSGGLDGAATRVPPEPVDGFVRVPPQDNTSAHYAKQWLAIGLIAAVFSSRRAMRSLRLFVRHRFVG